MTTFSRADWGARAARSGPGPLDPAKVQGLAFHWPAMSSPLRTVDAIKAALRNWQNYHMDGQGWSDIGYQQAIDQDGNEYVLRGLRIQSGANGDTDVNERFGAVLLILAPGEKPSPAMIATARKVVARHRRMFPDSKRLVGHGQIRPEPTACPGPAVMAALKAGTFEPLPPKREQTRGPLVDHALDDLTQRRRKAKDPAVRRTLRQAKQLLKTLRAWPKKRA